MSDQQSKPVAYYIVYAGNGNTQVMSENAQTDHAKANEIFDNWVADFEWVYINRTIPGTPDKIIRKKSEQ